MDIWLLSVGRRLGSYEQPCDEHSVQAFVEMPDFISLGWICQSGTARLYGKLRFNFLRNYQTIFQSGSTILHHHQQCMKVPISPQPPHHLLLPSVQTADSAILVSV